MNLKLTKTPVVVLLALICCALWGSAFPCIKIGYRQFAIAGNDTASQILFAGIRFFLAGCMVILFCSILYKELLIPRKFQTLKHAFFLSLFQTILQYIFFYVGLSKTTGSKAAVIEAANVFLAILVSGFLFKMEKITSKKMIGCLIGFAGVIIINLGGGLDAHFSVTGEGFILLSTAAYAFSSVIIKYYSDKENTVLLSGWQFLIGGAVMILIGFACGGHIAPSSWHAIALLIYMAFISACAYTIWGLLLANNPVSKIAVYGFSNPVFGVLFSAILLHETTALNLNCIAALILVCAGIILANHESGGTTVHPEKC